MVEGQKCAVDDCDYAAQNWCLTFMAGLRMVVWLCQPHWDMRRPVAM